jgi:hypothetical protein
MVLVFLFAGVSVGGAQDAESVWADFDEEVNPPGWEVDWTDGGEWLPDGGILYGTGHAWYSYVEHDWYDLEVRFTAAMEGGLHVNVRADADRYVLGIEHTGDAPTEIRLYRDSADLSTLLGEQTGYVGDEFEVFMAVVEGRIFASVNGLAIDVVDPEPLDAGKFAFESLPHTRWVQIDNVELTGTRTSSVPDLAFVDISAQPLDDPLLEIVATIANDSEAPADGGLVFIEIDGRVVAESPVGPIAPGAAEQMTWIVDTGDAAPDSISTIVGWIEPAGPDDNTLNNETATNVEWPAAMTPATTEPQPTTTAPPGTTAPFETTAPPETRAGPSRTGDESSPGLDPATIIAVLGAGAVATMAVGIRARGRWRRNQQARAEDDGPRGECRPGETYTKREFEPDVRLRQIASLELEARDLTSAWSTTTVVREGRVIDALNEAVRLDQRSEPRDRDDQIHRAATRLAGLARAWLSKQHRTHARVFVTGSHEGGSVETKFIHWICGPDRRWPDPDRAQPKREWSVETKDEGRHDLGHFDLSASTSDDDTAGQLVPLLTALVAAMTEHHSPALPKVRMRTPLHG